MIKFTKMQGLGNDYVYIDCTSKQKIEHVENLVRFLSNRHFGIGSDGVIFICSSSIADFKMVMYNSDGTEASMCGNGIRCVGKYVYDNGLTKKEQITIETLSGIRQLDLMIEKEKVQQIKVDMGEPILNPQQIPVILENMTNINQLVLQILDQSFTFTCVSIGNPHAITIVDDVDKFDVETYGKVVEKNSHFPERTNVEFIQIIDRKHIKMRVWERGTGETLACGTGACASVIACHLNGLVDDTAKVQLLGGNLWIEWQEDNNHVYMTGPAKIVFKGEIEFDTD